MGELAERRRHGRAPAGRADGRRAHRRRRPRVGAGRVRRPARRPSTSTTSVRRLNKLCAPAIAVRDPAWVDDGFDARFSATYRHYRYDVWNAPDAEPAARRAGLVRAPAAGPLGDAGGLRPADRRARLRVVLPPAEGRRRASPSRRWCGACCRRAGRELDDAAHLRFEIRANAFCHQMVRSIVGTLVDVGLGQGVARRHPRRSSSPATARPPARSPRRTASCCGRSATRAVVRSDPLTTVRHTHAEQLVAPDEIVAHLRAGRALRRAHPHGGRRRPCATRRRRSPPTSWRPPCREVHVSTVYRTLALLEEIGAVRHVHLSHGPAVYEHAASADVRHLVCEVCGRHVAVPARGVRRRARRGWPTTTTSCSTAPTSPSSAAAASTPRLTVRSGGRRTSGLHRTAIRRVGANGSASDVAVRLICDSFAFRVAALGKGDAHAGDAHPGRVHRRPDVAARRARRDRRRSRCACG